MNAKYIAFIIIFLLTVLGVFIAVLLMKSTWFKQFWRSRGKGKVMDAPPSVDEIEMQSDHDFDTNEAFYPTS